MSRVSALRARLRLLADLSRRDVRSRFAGSYLGFLWAFIVPLFSSLVYVLVFSLLMKGAMLGGIYGRYDFTTLYFLGFAPWLLFADVVARSTSVIRENRSLIRNLQFDSRMLPLSTLLSSCIAHAVVLAMSVILVRVNGYPLSDRMYLLPVYFALLVAFTLGLAYLVASVSVYLADLAQVVPIALSLMFFATPILYTPAVIEQSGSKVAVLILLKLNPMKHIVEGYRVGLVAVDAPLDIGGLAVLAACAAGTFALGYGVFRRLEKGFADVL